MIDNEIKILSYIKKPERKIRDLKDPKLHEYFISIENVEELIAIKNKLDSDYLDGYISIIYNNKTIMGPTEWDLIDQLWAYILNMIEEVLINKHAETMFPDQPLKFSFTLFESEVLVRLGHQKYMLPKDALFNSLLNNAYAFFHLYQVLFDHDHKLVEYELNKIEELKKSLDHK